MSTPSTSGAGNWLRLGVPGALIVIACGLYVYFNAGDSAPDNKPAASATPSTVFGPGSLNNSDGGESLNHQDNKPQPLVAVPNGLAATPDGQLQINSGLRDVIDYFLLQQPGNNQAQALRDYLKTRLPPQAASQALQIADHYQSYMTAHDALLAGQNLGDANVERLSTWREQRDRLRLGMLGEQVVQAWYQDEDNRFAQALDQLQQRGPGATVKPVNAAGRSMSNQEQEDSQIQETFADQTQSYAARRQDELAWSSHFQAYVEAATRIKQDPSLSFAERERRIQVELARLFTSDRQRQRARDMGP